MTMSRRRASARSKAPWRSVWRAYVATAVIAGSLGAGTAIAAEALTPTDEEPLVAVFPPWMSGSDAEASVLRAGGLTLAPGEGHFIQETYGGWDGYADALRREGAWLVLSGAWAAFLCASTRDA